MERQKITFSPITLEWSDWVSWNNLKLDARKKGGIRVPEKPGVYEVKYQHTRGGKRLDIGRTSNLRYRIKQGLVKGKAPHSAGKKIRANENVSMIVVRWAITDRPAAAEEELHVRYKTKFGKPPKYVKHT